LAPSAVAEGLSAALFFFFSSSLALSFFYLTFSSSLAILSSKSCIYSFARSYFLSILVFKLSKVGFLLLMSFISCSTSGG